MKKIIILFASTLSIQCYALSTTFTGSFLAGSNGEAAISECSTFTPKKCNTEGDNLRSFDLSDSADRAFMKREKNQKDKHCHDNGSICTYNVEYKADRHGNSTITKINSVKYIGNEWW